MSRADHPAGRGRSPGSTEPANEDLESVAMGHYRRLLLASADLDLPAQPYLMTPALSRERYLGMLQGLLAAASAMPPEDRLIGAMVNAALDQHRDTT